MHTPFQFPPRVKHVPGRGHSAPDGAACAKTVTSTTWTPSSRRPHYFGLPAAATAASPAAPTDALKSPAEIGLWLCVRRFASDVCEDGAWTLSISGTAVFLLRVRPYAPYFAAHGASMLAFPFLTRSWLLCVSNLDTLKNHH